MKKNIAELNDRFRRGDDTWQWMITDGASTAKKNSACPTGKARQLQILDSDIMENGP